MRTRPALLFTYLLVSCLLLSMAPVTVAFAAPGRESMAVEPEDSVRTDISDLTNPGKDPEAPVSVRTFLTVLDSPVCSQTFAALKEGEVITPGTCSEAAAGLQQLLLDFGCSIVIDGSAGPDTFAVLNRLLTSFGMEETDKVDVSLYTELLKLLLLVTEETAARDLLNDVFGLDEAPGKYDYLMGCAYYVQGDLVRAKDAFERSTYEDYKERAAACTKPLP